MADGIAYISAEELSMREGRLHRKAALTYHVCFGHVWCAVLDVKIPASETHREYVLLIAARKARLAAGRGGIGLL
jgi:hypothetical protein